MNHLYLYSLSLALLVVTTAHASDKDKQDKHYRSGLTLKIKDDREIAQQQQQLAKAGQEMCTPTSSNTYVKDVLTSPAQQTPGTPTHSDPGPSRLAHGAPQSSATRTDPQPTKAHPILLLPSRASLSNPASAASAAAIAAAATTGTASAGASVSSSSSAHSSSLKNTPSTPQTKPIRRLNAQAAAFTPGATVAKQSQPSAASSASAAAATAAATAHAQLAAALPASAGQLPAAALLVDPSVTFYDPTGQPVVREYVDATRGTGYEGAVHTTTDAAATNNHVVHLYGRSRPHHWAQPPYPVMPHFIPFSFPAFPYPPFTVSYVAQCSNKAMHKNVAAAAAAAAAYTAHLYANGLIGN